CDRYGDTCRWRICDAGLDRVLRHCERSEAIQEPQRLLDCFVASLLAMTNLYRYAAPASAAKRLGSPSQTILPCSRTYTRSACGRAKVTFCSPRITVRGVVCRSRSSALEICARMTGARPSVGSSRIKRSGFIIK